MQQKYTYAEVQRIMDVVNKETSKLNLGFSFAVDFELVSNKSGVFEAPFIYCIRDGITGKTNIYADWGGEKYEPLKYITIDPIFSKHPYVTVNIVRGITKQVLGLYDAL